MEVHHGIKFTTHGHNAAPWTGTPTTLAASPPGSVNMPQTINGYLTVTYWNTAAAQDNGSIVWSSGGGIPTMVEVDAQMGAPVIQVQNFFGNNLTVTNLSKTASIQVAAWGPGFGTSTPLPSTGVPVPLPPYAPGVTTSNSATCVTSANFMALTLSSTKGYTVFALYVGNAVPQLYAVNAPDPTKVPAGYARVTSGNSIQIMNNWLGATMYVANLSPGSSQNGQVSLVNL